MFITKKRHEREMREIEKRIWEDQERYRMQDDYCRRFNALEKRIFILEKKAGLVEETKHCPCEVTVPNY